MTRRAVHPLPLIALALAAVLALAGCDAPQPKSNLATIQMAIGTKKFTLEVADNDSTRQLGLMNRDSMPADRGMIFVFADEEERAFWMKNTRIPLDILFVGASGRVVSIKSMQPYDLRATPSDGKAKFAIELNVGAATNVGAKPGDQLIVPADLKSKD